MMDLTFGRAHALVVEAEELNRPADRYLAAYRAAEQVALAAVAAVPGSRARTRQTVWAMLDRIAPELAEWSAFFTAVAPRVLAVQAGATTQISERDAADLVRDAQQFLGVVSGWLRRRTGRAAEVS